MGNDSVSSAPVVARSETVAGIVVDGYVECVREPVQRTFNMPADRIVDHPEAIADNVRLCAAPLPPRQSRLEERL